MRQRDQHHKETILKLEQGMAMAAMQHEEKMIRLRIQLQKASQKNSDSRDEAERYS